MPKNIEVYFDELMNKWDGIHVQCFWRDTIKKDTCIHSCHQCNLEFIKWLNQEYKNPIKVSDDLRVVLKNINRKYKWIIKDSDLNIYVCTKEPANGRTMGNYINLDLLFGHLFESGTNWDGRKMLIEDMLDGG